MRENPSNAQTQGVAGHGFLGCQPDKHASDYSDYGGEVERFIQDNMRRARSYLLAAILAMREIMDEMKSAYGEAVYYTTDTRLLPENIWRAMLDAAFPGSPSLP